jgi:hypothetical protein
MKMVLLCAVLLGLTGARAQAQLGVYGMYEYTRFTDNYVKQETSLNGGKFGVYDDFVHLGPLRLGADLRGDVLTSNTLRYRSVLAGARLAVKPPILPIKPYLQASVGFGGTQSKGPFAAGISAPGYNGKFLYQVLGGLDYTLIPHIDLRAIELGYGRETGTNGTTGNNPSSSLFLLSAGAVVRF